MRTVEQQPVLPRSASPAAGTCRDLREKVCGRQGASPLCTKPCVHTALLDWPQRGRAMLLETALERITIEEVELPGDSQVWPNIPGCAGGGGSVRAPEARAQPGGDRKPGHRGLSLAAAAQPQPGRKFCLVLSAGASLAILLNRKPGSEVAGRRRRERRTPGQVEARLASGHPELLPPELSAAQPLNTGPTRWPGPNLHPSICRLSPSSPWAPEVPPCERKAAAAMAADVEGDVYVLVEHPFEYTGKDGGRVAIQPNERYRLLRRSTEHWWHVRREPDGRPFYLPAQYVRELPAIGDPATAPAPPASHPGPAAPEPLAYDYRFVSAPVPAARDGLPAEPRGRAGSLCGPAPRGAGTQRRSLAPGQPTCLYTRPAARVRPAQSLDDLARAGAAPPAGLLGSAGRFKACSVAGSWVCPRPLARSDSENLYEAIEDVRAPPQEERPEQVDEASEPVYANIERQPLPTSPSAPAAPRPGPVWETHTDTDTGRPYYYNPDTGVTTWELPFEATEGATSPATSPSSVGSRESLETEWGQYWDEESRRVFFYNPVTGDRVWEDEPEDEEDELKMQPGLSPGSPKDQRPPTPETDYPELLTSYPEEDYSPSGSLSEPGPASPLATPPGWSCHVDSEGQTVYTNHFTQEQWVKLEDQHGKPYFYNPNDTSVRWDLPQVPVPAPRSILKSSQDREAPAQASPPEERIKTLDKAGVLHRTKTADKGKRVRKKHWSASWTVLEGGILTFFKDSKSSTAVGLRQPSKLSTPEYTVDLKGASLSWAPKDKSSKKNVLELRSRDGSEYLIQHDSEAIISTWHKAIAQGIQELSADLPPEEESENSSLDFGSRERLGSWREDETRSGAAAPALSPGGQDSDLSKVRHKLRKFLLRRPTLQSLRDKGYIKDQVFGCALATLCERERSPVPRFVQQCIRTVEARGLDIDGLYRISGNLATIQKLRYRVDHDERLDLEDGRWEDVHVITGALKLFFRELPEPLFPFSHFPQFIAAIKLQDQAKRSRCVRDLVRSLPAPNHDTLRLLFQHLCRVIEHGEQNRMSVQSVAIVFGPTLLRPETEEASMPMTMVFQNQVVELILQQCADIFPPH